MTPHASTTGNRTVDAVLDFEKAMAREKRLKWKNQFPFKKNGGGRSLYYAVFLEMR